MIPNYQQLQPTYAKLLDAMQIIGEPTIAARCTKLLQQMALYEPVSQKTGVPIAALIALNEREDSSNFHAYLGKGQPLNRVTTPVPRGRGPFPDWPSGAINALHLDALDQ